LIWSTSGRIRLTSRSLLVPKTLANAFPIKVWFSLRSYSAVRTKLLKLKPNILDEAGPVGGSGDVRIPSLPNSSASSVPLCFKDFDFSILGDVWQFRHFWQLNQSYCSGFLRFCVGR
jgi:hypothetical protein